MSRETSERGPPAGAAERLWELSTDLMGVADKDGQLLAMNSAWTAALGWTEAQIMAGRAEIVHPEDLGRVQQDIARVAATRETLKFESRLLTREGVYRRFSWRASSADGLIYLVGRDITERLRQEEVARHAQKMEAVGQLTGGIAHDFNNLLTIVRSSLDLLKTPDLPEQRRRRYLAAMDDAVERATKVTQQLLAFARRQKLDPEVFDVGERIADVSELLRQIVGPRIGIETSAPAGACWVETDLCQFETALMNLAINARDAMCGEGRLAIEARAADRVPAIRNHAASEGPFVAITVRDTGAGIAPELHARIFEPFFTTKETGKGTGLGLSQVYGFVKQSGGAVEVESERGAGAAFTIYLPRSAEGARSRVAPQAAEATSRRPAELAGVRALVVEDNEEVGRFCVSMLRDLGCRPVWARSAGEALTVLERDAEDCDIVFSDVVMPGMSGIELAEAIRARRPALPILLTSGYSAVLAEEGSRGFPLLAKPYSARDLEQALARMINERPGADPRPRRRRDAPTADDTEKPDEDRAAELVRKAAGAASADERRRLLQEAKALGLRAAKPR